MWLDVLFQYLAAAGLLHSLLLGLFLWKKPTNQTANRILAALVCVISVQALLNAFDNEAFFSTFPHLTRVSWLLPSLFGPMVYVFTRKLTTSEGWSWQELVHAGPFAAYLAVLSPYFLQSAEKKLVLIRAFEASSQADFGWLTQLSPFIILAYFMATLALLNRYEARLRDSFSEIDQQRLLWLRQFIWAVIGILVLTAASFFGRKWEIPILSDIYHYPYLLVLILVYWIGYQALFQQKLLTPEPEAPPATPIAEPDTAPQKYQKTALPTDILAQNKAKLAAYMAQAHPYRSSDLSLQRLADLTDMPRHQLSQVINEGFGVNFFDFVNGYRVAAAQQLLLDPAWDGYTVLAIGLEAGFNSKTTFNAVFRDKTGLTPTEFRKKMRPTL